MASPAFAEDNPGTQLTLGDLHLRVKAGDSGWDAENGRIRPASCRLEVQILPSAMARPAMIDRREILEAASVHSLLTAVVEKDYVLGWILAGIDAHEDED
jgi:hypothetical protein